MGSFEKQQYDVSNLKAYFVFRVHVQFLETMLVSLNHLILKVRNAFLFKQVALRCEIV